MECTPKASEINVKEFWKFVRDLEKRKIIGNFVPGQLVLISEEKEGNIYRIEGIKKDGYILKRATMQKIGKIVGPYFYSQLREFQESDDWTSIQKLNKNGFLILHTTNVFAGGNAKIEGVEYDHFINIERDLVSGDKFTVSCVGISPLYEAGVCIHRDCNHAVGIVLSKGKIVAAYPSDAATVATHAQYRKPSISMYNQVSLMDQVPVRIALTTTSGYNELIPQNWGVGGVFYTQKTPEEEINKLKELAIKYQLELYAIDEITKNWKMYSYKKSSGMFELVIDTKQSIHLFKEAV